MVTIAELSHSFADRVLYDVVNLFFKNRARAGIVGANGSGKTTLLKIISGEFDPDKCKITISGKKSIGMLSQDIVDLEPISMLQYFKDETNISFLEKRLRELENKLNNSGDNTNVLKEFEEITQQYEFYEGYSFESLCGRIIKGLGFKNDDLYKKCDQFSGGMKTRIGLALLLLKKPDIMLLDEPTNHLDTESMEWLESYLKDYHGTIITVSHDIRFLDKVTNETYEIFNKTITKYSGNYTYYKKEKEKKLELLKKEYESQAREIKRLEDFIERFRYKASKASQVQSRIKMLEKFKEIKLESSEKSVKIKFAHKTQSGNSVVELKNISHSYGEKTVLENVNLQFFRGEKIAIVGVNGAGKSTLSAIISKSLDQTSGSVEYGYNVKPAYFSQSSSDTLNKENSILEEINTVKHDYDDVGIRSLLGAFLFSGDDIYKKIKVLSGGERSRVALIKILMNDTNFLILDEPTNHLDRSTKDIFQKALLEYEGTIMIVSHDRYFLDNLVDKVIEVKNNSVKEYTGDYSYFVWKREQETNSNIEETATVVSTSQKESSKGFKSKEQRRLEAEKRKENAQKTKGLKKELSEVESLIEKYEEEKSSTESLLCSEEVLTDSQKIVSLNIRLKELNELIETNMEKWEEITMAIEEILG
ncbi:MAG: ABC transporter ATP-binding protein [Candidatus Cloacimonadota bacterium]|nr:MAG: ABC transporter ATP-binding protein [Candidatus Cloacimonadota bacterium]PIE81374.1 MAG: ABC transporter ATP-binding protein [Candidatus Delongbacteria bacterium]